MKNHSRLKLQAPLRWLHLFLVLVQILMLAPLLITTSCSRSSATTKASAVDSGRELRREIDRYLKANSHVWPQCPFDHDTEPDKFIDWWETKLAPYSKRPKPLCPDDYILIPQEFSTSPAAPFASPTQPWLKAIPKKETGTIFFLLPDGSVAY